MRSGYKKRHLRDSLEEYNLFKMNNPNKKGEGYIIHMVNNDYTVWKFVTYGKYWREKNNDTVVGAMVVQYMVECSIAG